MIIKCVKRFTFSSHDSGIDLTALQFVVLSYSSNSIILMYFSASCGVNNGGCERKCKDTKEGPICNCPIGFALHQDRRSCLGLYKITANRHIPMHT